MERLPLIPLDDSVLFPGMTATVIADGPSSGHVFVVARHDDEFATVGTVAEVAERARIPGGRALNLVGLHRGVGGTAVTDPDGTLMVEVTPHPDPEDTSEEIRVLEREYRAVVEEILDLRGADDRIRAFLRSIQGAGSLADTVGYSPDVSTEEKLKVLETIDVTERLRLAVELQRDRLAELQIRKRIHDDVTEGAESQQREYFLRKQMDSIRK
ncbi:MAG TPA: LON peptidase substrate-binding domain-containing protein, partial [Solirubrobacterales bacterium]|nr:LON peptidase substrate-binding domain-containing protein [Solirubrobacterales bacterium]